jgi:hypothetical protein
MTHLLIFFGALAISFHAMALDQSGDPSLDQWRALMKYERKNGRLQSPIMDSSFFLSKEGATNADEELRTELQTFSKLQPSSDQHPQCQYPARYELLRKKFSLAPPVPCPNFDSWRRSYGITRINVLYGSQFISTPTSAFGHAFFLIDSDTTREYLRATYNYGADIPEDVGIRLISDGIGGGFRGNYSVVPLYQRLHSYNDIENRDIWEYSLALSPDERDFIVKYLWEAQDKFAAPYYFLTGNCASEILETLNLARPGLHLKTSSPLFTSPQEIFRVLAQNDLVADVHFRPSLEKQLDRKLRRLSASQLQEFRNIVASPQETPHDATLAESILSFIQLQRVKNQGVTPDTLKQLERNALIARAEAGDVQPFRFAAQDWPAPPHEAQGPQVLALGHAETTSGPVTSFALRPAFHDLMQTDAGFLDNSSIDILAVRGQIPTNGAPRLETLTLARIVNFREIKVYDPLALSWIMEGKLVRNPYLPSSLRYYLNLSPEMGFATEFLRPSVLLFALAGLEFRDHEAQPFGKAGYGPRVGLVGTFGRFKTFLSYRLTWQSPDAESWQKRETEIDVRYNLNRSWDLLAEYNQQETAANESVVRDQTLSFRYSF